MQLSFLQTLRKEFSCAYAGLDGEKAELFQESQWQSDGGKRWWYMGYRWLLCIFLLYGLLFDWVLDDLDEIKCKGDGSGCRAKWLVYCTNWAYSVLTVQALMAAYLATLHPATANGPSMTTFHKVYWVLNNISNGLAPCVSLIYWTLVYTPERIVDFSNLKGHVVNTCLVAFDLMMVAHPVRLLHVYQPMALGLGFFGFSCVYYYAGGTNRQLEEAIYPAFNWRRPLQATFLATCCEIGVLLFYVCVWCIFVARRKVAAALVARQESEEKQDFIC